MRKIIAILGVCLLSTIGCKHVGGKCDCGPSVGEATTYAPYSSGSVKVETPVAPKVMPK